MTPSSDPIGLWDAIFLGIVQGLTEFFPVSSDGHLVLAQHLLGYAKHNLMLDVLLHFGTLGAIVWVFRKEISPFVNSTLAFRKKSPSTWDRKTLWIWVTTFVTGIVGLAFEDFIERTFSSVSVAGIGFLITSTFLFAAVFKVKGSKSIAETTWAFPILIGLAQASALLPGVSRSGMTIATALLLGCSRRESGRYSFMAAIPIISLAVIYEARKLVGSETSDLGAILVGVVVSFAVGIAAIRGLMAMLERYSLLPFAIYAGLLGVLTLSLNS